MTAIVFEVLLDSPDSQGDARVTLPRLQVVGYEAAGAHGIVTLPRLQVFGAGVEASRGAAAVTLPRLQVRGFQLAGNHGIAQLPGLRAAGADPLVDAAPNPGAGAATLPAPQVAGTGVAHEWGGALVRLVRLQVRGQEVAGDSAIVTLPPLRAFGRDAASAPANRFTLEQSPGYLYSYFANPLTPELLSEALGALDAAGTRMPFALAETTGAAATALAKQAANLSEALEPAADASSLARFVSAASESLSLLDTARVVLQFIATESLAVDALGTMSRQQIIAAVEYLQASAIASSQLHAIQAVVETLVLVELERHGWREEHVESVAYAEALVQTHHQIEALVEAIVADDVADSAMRFTFLLAEGVAAQDSADSVGHFFELLTESLAATAVFRIAGEAYVAWALNLETEAASRYDNFGFNSFAEFGGTYYGLMDDGLYEIGGPTDDGTQIKWAVRGGLDNHGSALIKRMGMAYVGLRTDGQVVLKLVTTSDGRREEHWYRLEGRTGSAVREDRLKPDQGPESVYWSWELFNLDGTDAHVDCVRLVPLLTSRRV